MAFGQEVGVKHLSMAADRHVFFDVADRGPHGSETRREGILVDMAINADSRMPAPHPVVVDARNAAVAGLGRGPAPKAQLRTRGVLLQRQSAADSPAEQLLAIRSPDRKTRQLRRLVFPQF